MLQSKTVLKSLQTNTIRASVKTAIRYSSSNSKEASKPQETNPEKAIEEKAQQSAQQHFSTKTQAQLDEELRQKMSGISGDGGEAGVEYEDGQPVAMKKSVKHNMFRYI